ncbi:cysteine methyltransferase [Leptospira perolatii]|uniref:Cysteine methyltransferase n=1 Tax=Leptospira perolatii TaxID=2023191 RepID=A0A2M9ZRP5_9LEPT|nr:cysteine methyltransferase [Leptospira perolatii]PJZ74639.1 cysteine methyltransferase [Leptospira perolatii]
MKQKAKSQRTHLARSAKKKATPESFYDKVYAVVKKIPIGKVTSYGRIAALLGTPRAARAVGYALNALEKSQVQSVPWQRVINGQGLISFRGDSRRAILQRKLLEAEKVKFDSNGSVDFEKYGWP